MLLVTRWIYRPFVQSPRLVIRLRVVPLPLDNAGPLQDNAEVVDVVLVHAEPQPLTARPTVSIRMTMLQSRLLDAVDNRNRTTVGS